MEILVALHKSVKRGKEFRQGKMRQTSCSAFSLGKTEKEHQVDKTNKDYSGNIVAIKFDGRVACV